jgi:hypothetical protein
MYAGLFLRFTTGMVIAAILFVVLVGLVAGDLALVRAMQRRKRNSDR